MTKLKCDARHCMSNRDGCCCRPDIQVGGNNATAYQETCCESFRPIGSNTTNATDYSHTNTQMPIRCSAVKCVYNKQCHCGADAITMEGVSAKKAEQTACRTFKCGDNCSCK